MNFLWFAVVEARKNNTNQTQIQGKKKNSCMHVDCSECNAPKLLLTSKNSNCESGYHRLSLALPAPPLWGVTLSLTPAQVGRWMQAIAVNEVGIHAQVDGKVWAQAAALMLGICSALWCGSAISHSLRGVCHQGMSPTFMWWVWTRADGNNAAGRRSEPAMNSQGGAKRGRRRRRKSNGSAGAALLKSKH